MGWCYWNLSPKPPSGMAPKPKCLSVVCFPFASYVNCLYATYSLRFMAIRTSTCGSSLCTC
uniref:Uncharacterized protein n=1 Tax=Rhizophora mucronata TaxID=61149 RepID=A0A2P2NF04_RHIMU